jgi:putative nucleotidyltransferase with HDIG domain
MTAFNRDLLIDHLKQLPPLPAVVTDLIASMEDDDVCIADIVQKITYDQGLTARILRVANSPFYGLQNKVGTLSDALVILGFRAVRGMVLVLGINGAFRFDHCRGFDAEAYLRHGIGTALGARFLAPMAGQQVELAFTAALLHDIGQLVLASGFSPDYALALEYREKHDCPLVVAERDVLGLGHPEVGAMLADTWRFPDSLRQAIASHHSPAGEVADSLANVVHVADCLAHALGLSGAGGEMVMAIDRTAWERLGLDGKKCAAIAAEIDASFEESWMIFKG